MAVVRAEVMLVVRVMAVVKVVVMLVLLLLVVVMAVILTRWCVMSILPWWR